MGRQNFLFEHDGETVMGFDTGLDARSFARAKLSQLLTEHGQVVRLGDAQGEPDSAEHWKPSGVIEHSGAGGAQPTMVVWGPAFEGERLDLIVNDGNRQDEALSAVALWLRAILALDRKSRAFVPLWPCAAIVSAEQVFFAPPALALRCLRADEESLLFSGYEWYVHPDFGGVDIVGNQYESAVSGQPLRVRSGAPSISAEELEAEIEKTNLRTAFTAAAMLYRIISGAPPFAATNDTMLHQDMREGNFLPVRFAAPGLDARLAGVVQKILEPSGKKNEITKEPARKPSPGDLLEALRPRSPTNALPAPAGGVAGGGLAATLGELISPVSEADIQALEKEKKQFLKVSSASIKTKRFVARNTRVLLGAFAFLAVVVFFVANIITTRAAQPTTAGMEPLEVIESFYNAFGELDHMLMDNIVLRGVARSDITMVTNLFVIDRVRMAHEFVHTLTISAREWQEMGGGATELNVFGVTDLRIEPVLGRESSEWQEQGRRNRNRDEEELHFRVDYLLWMPAQMLGYMIEGAVVPVYVRITDLVSLVRRQGNWRISYIARVTHLD